MTISTVDLHTHSTASDGTCRPADLVALAARRGVRFLGLTDHDTTAGLVEAVAAGQASGVTVVPGIELGIDVAAGELHMLGYFIDPGDARLQGTLARLRAGRETRAARMVERLRAIGLPVTLADVERLAGGGTVTRAHVARALVEAGAATSVDDAFARYLDRGRPGYVPRPRLTAPEAIDLIRGAGGVAALAHPYTVADLDETLPALVAAGLVGLEAYYGAYAPEERAALAALAERYHLIPTGGSDYHGPGVREGRDLGAAPVPLETVERLREAAAAAR